MQNEFSLLQQEPAACWRCASGRASGSRPFSPLGGGWLTGKYRRGERYPAGSRMTLRPGPYEELATEETFRALEAFEAAAAERDVEPAALAIAWVLGDPQVTAVVVGPRRPEHLDPALGGARAAARAGERDELAELFA